MDPVFAVAVFVLMMSCLAFVTYKKAPNLKSFFGVHPLALKALIWGYIVFNACFSFPISSARFPLDFSKGYLLIASYGVIALSLAGIYGSKKHLTVFMQTFAFCVLGLICRYFLEYGEVSNSYNFTLINIFAYLTIIPAYTVFAYSILDRKLKNKSREV